MVDRASRFWKRFGDIHKNQALVNYGNATGQENFKCFKKYSKNDL
jgi:hypothetical protein